MIYPSLSRCQIPALLLLALALFPSHNAGAAKAFTQATVTQVENSVTYGSINAGDAPRRTAAVSDIVRSNNFLFTRTAARAELQYEDGSVVRIGQNTVFSFDAASRTLALEKGSFIFYVPKGSGGGTIKTPTLTAAITGTVGKVSENTIAVIEGVVTLKPDGRQVRAGQFARRNRDGSISISPFDPRKTNDGKLMNFNGLLPGVDPLPSPTRKPSDPSSIDTVERAQNHPGGLKRNFPDRQAPVKQVEQHTPAAPVIKPPRTRVDGTTPTSAANTTKSKN